MVRTGDGCMRAKMPVNLGVRLEDDERWSIRIGSIVLSEGLWHHQVLNVIRNIGGDEEEALEMMKAILGSDPHSRPVEAG